MVFPKRYAEVAARLRVPAGFAVSALFLLLARPSWNTLALGGAIGLLGLALRAWAAGHLAKNERLVTSGPFAYLRNPLYMGTLIVGVGCAIAGAHLGMGTLLVAFFVLFYLPVVEEEEAHLRTLFPEYAVYEASVPKFRPRLSAAFSSGLRFSMALYKKNEEYQALAGFLVVMGLLAAKLAFFR
jgi:protein-S-isoprenylcysteine O-methyltransferase Ste14